MRKLLSAGLEKLRRSEPTVATGTRNARVVAVAAQKGGVGKTTSTVNLACALAGEGQRVLVVDVDAQGHVASALRDAVKPARVSLSEVLLAQKTRDVLEAVVPTAIDELHVTPCDKSLSETEALLATRVGREFILQTALKTARTHYDTILIDCPPNLGNLTLNALVAADHVLIPCDLSILAFEGVADLLGTVQTVNERLRHELRVLGILRTRVDARTRQINDAIGAALHDNYGGMLLDTVIPLNSALAKAQAAGQSVFRFAPKSPGAAAYRSLAHEVRARLAGEVIAAAQP